MKRFFQIIGIITLTVGSFMLTKEVRTASKQTDTLLSEIKSKKDGYKENAIEPYIDDDKIIPGINGREVDTKKSYAEMSKIGYFDDKLLVYKALPVQNTLDKNKDKYIIGLNNSKMEVSLIFKVKSSENITNIVKKLNEKNIKGTFFITSSYLEKHHNQIIELVQKGYTIGNLSNSEDYNDSDFIWMKTIITNIGNQKYNYCLVKEPKKNVIKICAIQDSYTILSENVIKEKPLLNLKKIIKPGSIITIEITQSLNNELEAILNYIESKGYTIKSLEEGLKE